jgi:hypothetical protein
MLRSPTGQIFLSQSVQLCEGGPFVLPDTGTYTLTVANPSVLAQQVAAYSFTPWSDETLREAPRPGQQPRAPMLTRVNPKNGVVGHVTTVSIYGTDVPTPTVAHLRNPSGASVPAVLLQGHAVFGALEGRVAVVKLDLSALGASDIGTYTIALDLADGESVSIPFGVVASTAATHIVVTTTGFDRLRIGVRNRVYITFTNPSPIDFYAVPIEITVPASAGTARIVTPPHDFGALIASLRAIGATDADVAPIASIPDQTTEAPQVDASGNLVLTACFRAFRRAAAPRSRSTSRRPHSAAPSPRNVSR